jgi:oligosaccharide repeat unit polymerase
MYIVTPINNIIYNFDNYPLFQFSLSDAFGQFLPRPLRVLVPRSDYEFVLVHEAFNVSSAHRNFLGGFGIIGSLFYQLIIGFIITIFYMKYKFTQDMKYCFVMAVLSHNIIFSFFVDFFAHLVFTFQIVIIFVFFAKLRFK